MLRKIAIALQGQNFRITAILFISGLAACSPRQQTTLAPPSPEVTVVAPLKRQITEWNDYTARVYAIDQVAIRPRVSGYIQAIRFREGKLVHAGDVLYVIDPRPYQAVVDQARGRLLQAQASKKLNDANLLRAQSLLKKAVISTQDYDSAVARKNQADAEVIADQAALESAGLNLMFTQVKSPINGKISDQKITLGNLVQADTTILTTIVSLDPVYAAINVDEQSIPKYQPDLLNHSIPVVLQLDNENERDAHHGTIDFINNQYDEDSGTLRFRATFPNPDGKLIPGAFGTVKLAVSSMHMGILIPDQAVGSDQDEKFVFLVGPDHRVKKQKIKLGTLFAGLRVVQSGLTGDEKVIVEGINKVQSGIAVFMFQKSIQEFQSLETAIISEEINPPVSINAGMGKLTKP
jgi:RND family efflux transporter MFP subunit